MDVTAFGLSDIGRQRQHNEDYFLVDETLKLYVVADGMGGHAAGEVASKIAVETIAELVSAPDEKDGTWPHPYDEQFCRSTNRLIAALKLANSRVLEAMRKDARLRGMGTTVVATLVFEDTVSFAHVGDSRAYLIRDGKISRMTNDHSWVFEQVEAGLLTEAEAEKHPLRNVITRALGGALTIVPDARELACEPSDVYLLCSDGLTGMMSEEKILELVTRQPDDLEAACQSLIALANENGGMDNITAILVRAN